MDHQATPRHAGARFALKGALWLLVYVGLVFLPIGLLLVGPRPAGREFLRELSVGLAFAGAAILMLQFALTARFRRIKAPYGIDLVYHFHREISYVALGLIVAHPVLLFVLDTAYLALLNPLAAPWRARFAVAAVLATVAIILTSVFRKRWRIRYETWRYLHGALAIAVVAFAIAHIEGVGHYVNAPWKRVLWIAYPGLWVGLLLYVGAVRPRRLTRRHWVVDAVRPERGGAWSLDLHADGHAGLRFAPGQFGWLTLADSPYRRREHPFSFSSSATHGDRVTLTIKEAGDFTANIGTTPPGAVAYLDGPYGHFSLDRHRAPAYVFIAGGIGITPIMSMLRTMADRGDRRRALLIDVNRDLKSIIFREELEALGTSLDLEVVHVLTQPEPGWAGPAGRPTPESLLSLLPPDHLARDYFICGPGPLMDLAESTLLTHGIHFRQVHSERFDLV